jgi:hypothetical protein
LKEVYTCVGYINSILLSYFFVKFAITDDERYVKVGLLTFIQMYGGMMYKMSKLYYFYNYFIITVFMSQAIIALQNFTTNHYNRIKIRNFGEKINQQIVIITFVPLIIEWLIR